MIPAEVGSTQAPPILMIPEDGGRMSGHLMLSGDQAGTMMVPRHEVDLSWIHPSIDLRRSAATRDRRLNPSESLALAPLIYLRWHADVPTGIGCDQGDARGGQLSDNDCGSTEAFDRICVGAD
jgi:hypothetical protein